MSTNEALLKGILNDPDDDTTRLVYADWLDEQGAETDQARAAFIRAQVRAAREPQAEHLNETARRLWEQYRVTWFGPDATAWDVDVCHRGFLSAASDSGWVRAVRAAGRSEEAWPLGPVPSVKLGYAPEPDDANPNVLAHMPGLASWGGLHLYKLYQDLDHDRLLALLRSPYLTGLVEFNAFRSAVGDDGIAALAESPARFRLRRLRLNSCGVSGPGMRRLARDPAFGQLRELTLYESAPEAAVAELLGSSNLANLRKLFLASCGRLGAVARGAMLGSPHLRGLRSLTLGFDDRLLAGRGAKRLAGWPGLASLESLAFLGDVGLTEDGLRAVVASPHLAGLAELSLFRCGCLAAGLADSPVLANLRRLEVDDGDLGSSTATRLRAVLQARFGDRVVFPR